MRLILMDFDDTITNNLEADYYSFIKTANEFELKTRLTMEEFKKLRKAGKLAEEIIGRLIDRDDERMNKAFYDARENILGGDETLARVKLNEGVGETLRYLKEKGFTTAIVTFKSEKGFVEKFLKMHGIWLYIDNIFCRETEAESVAEAKRNLYMKAMNYYQVKKEDVVVVGNLPDDVIAARDLGIRCTGVASHYSKKEDLEEYGEVISNIKELMEIL